jgi:hypothetical protein
MITLHLTVIGNPSGGAHVCNVRREKLPALGSEVHTGSGWAELLSLNPTDDPDYWLGLAFYIPREWEDE